MKYCTHCGNELLDEAVICPKCGCPTGNMTDFVNDQKSEVEPSEFVNSQPKPNNDNGLKTAAKVFMIIGTVFSAVYYLIPLCWTIPMTCIYCKKLKKGEKISTGFKVCSLLFVNMIAGIIMLCDKDE